MTNGATKIRLNRSGYGYPGFAKAWGIQWEGSDGTVNHVDFLVPNGNNREEVRTHWKDHLAGAIFQARNYDRKYRPSQLPLADTRLALEELRGVKRGSTTIDDGSGAPLSREQAEPIVTFLEPRLEILALLPLPQGGFGIPLAQVEAALRAQQERPSLPRA